MPHCAVFLNADDGLVGMVLVLRTGMAFNLPTKAVWEVFCLLISCYYVFDLEYFAAYGLLSVLDKYIFQVDEELHPPKSKRKRKKKPSCLEAFLEKYNQFITEDVAYLLGLQVEQ